MLCSLSFSPQFLNLFWIGLYEVGMNAMDFSKQPLYTHDLWVMIKYSVVKWKDNIVHLAPSALPLSHYSFNLE